MAGRQRMLLERYMKELLLAGQGVAAHHQDTRALLKQRLRVLIDGGATSTQFGPRGTVSLPPAPTAEIRSKLLEQERLLVKFTNRAEAFLAAQPIATRESIRNELLEDNIALLTTANEAVALLTQHSESRIQQLIRWEVAVVVLVVTLAILGIWRFLKAEQAVKVSQARTLDALRQSDAVKTSLLSSVSHELRTPLTSIKSMLFSLHHDEPLSRVSAEGLTSIEEQVDYLNRLVGNLLDMSRLDAGTLQPHREWNVLEDLVEGAIRRLGHLYQRSARRHRACAGSSTYFSGCRANPAGTDQPSGECREVFLSRLPHPNRRVRQRPRAGSVRDEYRSGDSSR